MYLYDLIKTNLNYDVEIIIGKQRNGVNNVTEVL